ncbi:MAG: hypothetical protein LUQ41_06940 [Methanomicrobiales archaeon]|nr:hypothetical protein [Methanomicrobiales archaeon]
MAEAVPRKRHWIILLAVFLILAASLTGIAWLWEQHTRQGEQHDYTYEVVVSFNTTIENVTLLLPVPERKGSPFLVDVLVNGTGYGVPPDWNLSIEEGNGTPMLAIRAGVMVPEYRAYPVPVEPGKGPLPMTLPPGTEYSSERPVLIPVVMTVMISGDHTIDTRDPVIGEPVFGHEGPFFPGTVATPVSGGSVYVHAVPVYVRFISDHPATLSLQTKVQGVNSIWRGGWVFNLYTDTVTLEVRNSTQGWLEGEGILLAGEGVYY